MSRDELARATVKFNQIPLFYLRDCAAQLLGIAPIATLERFVSLLLVLADYICRAPWRCPEGMGNCSSCNAKSTCWPLLLMDQPWQNSSCHNKKNTKRSWSRVLALACYLFHSWSRVLAIACSLFHRLWKWQFTLQLNLLFQINTR